MKYFDPQQDLDEEEREELEATEKSRLKLNPLLEPTPYLEKIMLEVEEDLKHNRNITYTNSKEEAISHLKSLM